MLQLALLLLALIWVASQKAVNLVDWVRAAWMLRHLPRAPGDVVISGVRRLLTGKRLRVLQKLNQSVVAGSGVFYYNLLWVHVRASMSSSVRRSSDVY